MEEKIDLEEEEDYSPKTISEAFDLFLAQDFEFDIPCDLPRKKFDKLFPDLKMKIIELCNLQNNKKLREACGWVDMQAEDATQIIIEHIWRGLNYP